MATAMVGAAFSVVGKALAPFTDDLLKNWAASAKLGDNVRALELELLSVKALLQPVLHKEINNSALKELLVMLQDLGYDAEDVLDELDYFRIQDELHGTFEAADEHAKGCACNLFLNAKAVGKQLICLPKANRREVKGGKAKLTSRSCCNPIHAVGKCFPCSSLPSVGSDNSMPDSPERSHTNEPKKLKFNRVDASKRMQHIVEQLRLVHQRVSGIITALGDLNWSTVPSIAQSRPITTSESVEPKLYGRDHIMDEIIHDITHGKHCGEALTVIPIVGPGGIGKTTLAQHIYHNEKVQQHFEVRIWTCVSLNFNANKLIQEIEKYIPEVDRESKGTAAQLIEQRLKKKRFLLVLDDIWDCSNEDEWKQLLLPFKKSQVVGNIIIVTTRFPAQAQIMVRKIDHSIYLQSLDHEEFKDLFLDFVFGDDQSRKDHTFLLETGDKIISRLKGNPLAAKTVSRLLKNQLDLVHWTRVLESKEWEQSENKNDIMPALKLSYDYLPSQLQLCFSYCALFPQGYKFEGEEIINFWIGLDVLHLSHGRNKRIEDIGLSHLTQLVNHGFFEKGARSDGTACYIIHDLLVELARNVSSHECLSIDSSQSQVSSLQIRPSIRHLSINIDGTSIKDRLTLKNCLEDFSTLAKRLKVEKLRSLMLFGEHHGCFVKTFGDVFREVKVLRVIFVSQASYEVEDLLQNFYYLVHLRYLRIQSFSRDETRFPNKLSRFYHMMVLDAKHYDNIIDLPRDMSNLIKLRHFLVCDEETHASIFEVGKLKSLQELRRFEVKQEDQGFELRQLGQLAELCGSLCIDNLENVQLKEEADEAKLTQKSRLHGLRLCWNTVESSNETALEEQVLERLKPSSNLLKLSITGHRGATCPSWLGINLSVKNLEYLRLSNVAWQTFPPIGELLLVNAPPEEISCKTPDKRFENLRRLELVNLAKLKKWDVYAPCQLFPYLEVLVIWGCSNLVELSFPNSTSCQQDKQAFSFPRLLELNIGNCPQLLSFPPVPWTEAPCSIKIERIGTPGLHKLVCAKSMNSEYGLTIEEKDISDGTFWNVLALHNLTTLTGLHMLRCQPLPLRRLQMLSSLRTLGMSCPSNAFPFDEEDNHVQYQFPVELLRIHQWRASGKDLTQLLTYFPKLSDLQLWDCEKITGLGVSVMGHQATATPGQSSSGHKVDQQQDTRAEEEIVTLAAEGLLLLPPQLQELWIYEYPEMSLCSNPLNDNKEDGRTRGGGGLQGLSSLRKLTIWSCPKFLSSYYSSCFPFPSSLEYLELEGVEGFEKVVPLSNLSSLTELSICECGDLRVRGLLSLLAQGHLTTLRVTETPRFFVDSEPSRVDEQVIPSPSSKLQELIMDDVAGVTATPICSSIFSSLTTMAFYRDAKVEHFTEEQESLLFINSLEVIRFEFCDSLKYLPARLHTLPSLKRLSIWKCKAIRMLPENGLPSSLQELVIDRCPEIQSLPKNCLPSSLQKLVISSCPGIRSLPKVNDLPSSLRELCIFYDNSKELTRHCRKLTGIIPRVEVRD